MAMSVSVRPLKDKKLLARAGRHSIITDRKPDDGGSDAGCTSGELLLLAIGSCAAGGVRRFLQANGNCAADFRVHVSLQPSSSGRDHDMVRISIVLPAQLLTGGEAALQHAVITGRVVSRVALGSELQICCQVKDTVAPGAAAEGA